MKSLDKKGRSNGPKPWKEADEHAREAPATNITGFSAAEMEGILGPVLSDHPVAREDLVLARAQSRWPQTAGSLAKHSWPEKFSNGRLTVRMSSDAYAQDFMMYRLDIMQKLRASGIREIESIFLQKGRTSFKRSADTPSVKPLPTTQKEPMMEGARTLLAELKKLRDES